jgi:DNA-binding transcriptional MerR regulator
MDLTVSKLAREVGLTADTVRYYEKAGLLPAPARTPAGYRVYHEDDVERLRFIRGAQRIGLRLREKELLDIRDRGLCPCGHTEDLLRRRVSEIDAEITRLQDGEWVRIELRDDRLLRELARSRGLRVQDATRVGYPERMRRYRRPDGNPLDAPGS